MYVSMKELLWDGYRENYAVLAINCFNLESARAVINAATEGEAPIIINIAEDHLSEHAYPEIMGPLVRTMAEQANVPVALNLDHGSEFKWIARAFQSGFSSIMIDASNFKLEENIRRTKEVVKLAKTMNLSVEAELGHFERTDEKNTNSLTDPSVVKQFVQKTQIDALAVSIGTIHGLYPDNQYPVLDFNRLEEINQLTQIPLVLHGGSGAGEENIKKAVQRGIAKINVGADILKSGRVEILRNLAENPEEDLFLLMKNMEDAYKSKVLEYMAWSGSKGKAKSKINKTLGVL